MTMYEIWIFELYGKDNSKLKAKYCAVYGDCTLEYTCLKFIFCFLY